MGEAVKDHKKRRPIRREIQRIVLIITLLSLVITSGVGILNMRRIRKDSETALTQQAQKSLTEFAESKTERAEESFARYAAYLDFIASYITEIYHNEETLIQWGHEVPPPLPSTPEGVYAMQRSFISPEIRLEDVRDQMYLLSNLEHLFDPMIKESDGIISVIYVASEQGLMLAYDPDSYKVIPELQNGELYYDYRDREWFSRGRTEKKAYFTGVYADIYGRGLTITCASPFFDAQGDFVGVVAADILITDLYNAVVDIDLGQESEVFLIDHTGHVISPEGGETTLDDLKDIDEMTRKQLLAGKSGIRLNGGDVYHAFAPINSVGWELVIHVPQSQVLASVRNMDRSIRISIVGFLVILLVVAILVLIIVRLFARGITVPLMVLGQDASKISEGDLDHRARVMENDELGDLAQKFNEMASSLKQRITDITVMAAERERISAELAIATKIQADMLPSSFQAFPGREEFDIFASMTPAREIGGDFYDFFLIDEDHLGVVMADVSGKGIPAALFMVVAKTMIKNQTILGERPGKVFTNVNNQLCANNREQLFVTAWMGILTISTGEMVCVNAGHEYPLLAQEASAFEVVRGENDPPLATVPGLTYSEYTMKLSPEDVLFLYTDGISEAKAADGSRFGTARLVEVLGRAMRDTAEDIAITVKLALDDFVGGAEPFDDVTMLALIYKGKTK